MTLLALGCAAAGFWLGWWAGALLARRRADEEIAFWIDEARRWRSEALRLAQRRQEPRPRVLREAEEIAARGWTKGNT